MYAIITGISVCDHHRYQRADAEPTWKGSDTPGAGYSGPKRLLTVIAGLAVLGVLGFFVLAWRPAIAPISPPPPGSFAPELVAQGEALAGGGFCAVCHTAKGGQKYAGGYPMQSPFGVIYSTNITPDPETAVEGDDAEVAAETANERMGEVPHLAAEAVDQDNGAPHAFVEHMEAFAVGADAVCYSFIAAEFHRLLFAGFYRRTRNQADRAKTPCGEFPMGISSEFSRALVDQSPKNFARPPSARRF